MGVSSLKARTARDAERLIRSIPVHIAVVDLGLPLDYGAPSDEAGARILDLLNRLASPPPVVVVRSPRTARDMHREMCAALRFDAFAIVDRRSADVEMMLKVLQRCMDRFYHGRWPNHVAHARANPFPRHTN
jgi:DNA-binding NarL/FixJ family response regulator